MKSSNRRLSTRRSLRRLSFQPRFEALESRHLLSGSSLPFDDSGLAPAGLQAICALPNLPVFNVHSYGAVGNGVADDTVAIRAALSAAEANGGGIVYLPTGTYAVDPQASDPVAWGPIFSITSSNIVFIGDGASNTHLVAYVEGLRNPLTNWYDTGDPYQQIGRGNMFQVNPSADVTGIQFRSLDINGQTGYTGNFTVGGNTATGDGWDTYDKAICLGFGTHHVDNTLIFNCNIRNWRGEEIYAGGGTNGAIDIINCNITGTNASAVSCSGSVLLSYSTIGGTSAGDDVYNGLEDYCFPTQSTTVDHSTIMCSNNPANPRGFGLSFEGEVGGSSLTVTNSVFANNNADILLQDTAHHVLIDSNTFTNSVLGGVITSIMNLYPGITSGFSDVTISNNTYNGNWQGASLCSLGNYGSTSTSNFPNLVISGNTVQKGQLLGGAFGGTLGSWTGFVVKNNILEAGTRDIDPGSQGCNTGLWNGTIRPNTRTTDFDNSGVLNYGGSGPTATMRILSDLTILYSNTAGSNPIAAQIDPAVLAGYPIGFTTTVYSYYLTNWTLKANPSWNTFSADIPVGPNGVTIRVNSQGLFAVVNPAAAGTTSTTVTSSASSSAFGQSVTFTATVSANASGAGIPTGTVTFRDGNTVLSSGTLDTNGQATFTTTGLDAGAHAISVDYGGDTNFFTSAGQMAQTVAKATTSASVACSANSSVFGQSVTFTATVSANASGTGTPTGMVTFMDGSTVLGTGTLDSTGKATFNTSTLVVGSHAISVSYGGATNFAASNGQMTLTVNQAATITTLTSSAISSAFGQSVTFTAVVSAVAPSSGIPPGTVAFMEGNVILATVTVDSTGTATFTTSALAVGNHTITAFRAGGPRYGTSSANIMQTINPANTGTSTTLTSSSSTSVFGQSVTFTATVSANAPGSATPTGMVTFMDGSTVLGTGTLDSTGKATFNTSTLVVGSHAISVSYGGATNFAASNGQMTLTVNQAATITTLTSSAISSAFGQSVTFTAVVSAVAPSSGIPPGTVAFMEGNVILATVTVDSTGTATFTTSALAVGNHTITAFRAGGPRYGTSSANIMQTINPANTGTSTTLTSSSSTSVFGQSVTFTATVSANAPGSATPTGMVTFMDGSTVLGTGTLDSTGKATFNTSTLVVGSHAISVSYGGATNFAASNGQMTLTVNQAATITTLTSSAISSAFGQSVTFTAVVSAVAPSSGIPPGTVAFMEGNVILATVTVDSTGTATFTTSALAVGNHTITAFRAGGPRYGTSSANIMQTINPANTGTSTTLTSSSSTSVFGQSVTFTATVSANASRSAVPPRTVVFLDGNNILGTVTVDSSGRATFSTSALGAGSHAITMSYIWGANMATSTATMTQTVNPANTSTTVNTSATSSLFGNSVTFTATVTANAPGAGIAVGKVTFLDGSTVLGEVLLDQSGTATFSTGALSVGSHAISMIFAGVPNFAGSTGQLTQLVQAPN